MSFLQGLHGVIAVVLLCSLLLVDEAGVPLPVAPNEALLLVAGVLISSGAVALWGFAPVAAITMAVGMVTGYGWARVVGQTGLRRLAARVGAATVLERLTVRVRSAGPVQIGALRVLPGIRPHITLVSGAAGVPIGTFLAGAVPALLLWLAAWLAVGMLIGLPAEYYLGHFEKLLLHGAILLGVGLTVLHVYRHPSTGAHNALSRLPGPARMLVAVSLDAGVVGSIVAGLLAVVRRLAHAESRGWIDVGAIAAAGLVYVAVARRGRGTVGEVLTGMPYSRRTGGIRAGRPPTLGSEAR